MQLACPHCHTQNRVEDARLAEAPNCGACHKPLLTGAPLAVTEEQFKTLTKVLKHPVVVDCWATWCGPCLSFAPSYAAAAEHFGDKATFLKVDTDAEQNLSGALKIRSIPTILVYENGRELERVNGAMSAGQFKAWMSQFF